MTTPQLEVEARVERDGFALDLSFVAGPGAVLGISGDIGSGKSTALWLVAGRLRAAAGFVRFGDETWDAPDAGVFTVKRSITLTTQLFQTDLAEERTGVENVVDAIVSHGPGRPDAESEARRVLASLGVEDHVVDRLPWTFSGAEAQRVSLAKALAARPAVVLLDEPLGALDKRTGAAVREFLDEWFAEFSGIVLYATTRADDLDRFASRTLPLP